MGLHTGAAAPDNAIAAAFIKSGYKSPEERLHQIAVDAWAKWPKPEMAGARRDHVMAHLDIATTFALFELWQRGIRAMAIGKLLNEVRQDIEANKPPQDAGQPATVVRTTESSGVKPDSAAGHEAINTPVIVAGGANSSPDAGASRRGEAAKSYSKSADRSPSSPQERAFQRVADTGHRMSRLDTFLIDGVPIGDCIASVIRTWAKRRANDMRVARRDVQFALSVAANIPGDARPRDHWKNLDEVDSIYARAEAEAMTNAP